MYKRLLVPIDGGELSDHAVQASIDLALQLGASITGFVAEKVSPLSAGRRRRDADEEVVGTNEAMASTQASQTLKHFEARARDAGVPFEGFHFQATRVSRAIIDAAESRGCDLILMVTHGRGAFGEFLYGSETKAVLADCKLPLLILK
jgi:nucleotide-binding universal stress UspA family protein